MTNDNALWKALRQHLPRRTWIPIADIYVIIQQQVPLDAEDLECSNPRTLNPHWKTNVRRVLYSKKRDGMITARES